MLQTSSYQVLARWKRSFASIRGQLKVYASHRAFVPSFTGALLYFTVLTFGGQMVTYLLSMGYNPIQVGVARTLSVVFEISSTWLVPKIMTRIGPIRTGLWSINWQVFCLLVGVVGLWAAPTSFLAASSLVVGTICSRVGLWGFDLSTQIIIQNVC